MPLLLLSEYVQEIDGRRDGKQSIALTLISELTGCIDAEDKQDRFFENKLRSQHQSAQQVSNYQCVERLVQ